MNRLVPASVLVLLAACGGEPVETPKIIENLPSADLSTDSVSFGTLSVGESVNRRVMLRNSGDLPMGISGITLLADGMESQFAVSWSPTAIVCPEPAEGEDGSANEANAKDTWGGSSGGGSSGGGSGSSGGGSGSSGGGSGSSGGGSGSSDTGGSSGGSSGGGGGGGGGSTDPNTLLGPGCELPITVAFLPTEAGRFYAAVQVDSVTQTVDEGEIPNYFRDPDNFHRVIQLDGEALQGVGNVVLRPSAIDMGHHYKGERVERFGAVANTGDGDLTVEDPQVCRASDCANYSGPHDCVPCEVGQLPCDDAFTLDLAHFQAGTLPAGSSTLVGFVFEPLDLDGAICEVRVPSSDPDSPTVTFTVKGNVGFDPENIAPTVELHNPPVGYRHLSADDLVLDIDMYDPNQPADTLICKVRSLRNDAKVADCSPETASGHVFAHIPVDLLEIGTDTLLVTVTDQSENRATASTTVLWGSYYPDSDDDGDGWGDDPADGDWIDCDDTDATVYPSAAELSDGKDNDCDGGIDERTIGGDDDGDSVSDMDGDCDDTDPATYPGAMELPDQKDNDCDGIVDEGTSLSDDDGDGFAELDLDCNDRDADVNPSAVELCDGIDNNCNSRVDEPGCQIVEFDPVIVGGITMTANAIGVGESTTMTVFVTDRDSEGLSFAWAEDSDLQSTGHTAISSPELQTITWTAPKELPDDSPGEVYSVNVIVQDEDGNQDWAFGEIWVYPEPVETSLEKVDLSAVDSGGCGSNEEEAAAAGAALVLPALGALALLRRRRRA